MASKFSEAERVRIMAEARDLLSHQPEPYTPPEEPLCYRRHEPPEPEPRRRREPRRPPDAMVDRINAAASTPQPVDWSGWETWVSARINAALAEERTALLAAIVEIVGQALGDTIGDAIENERAQWKRELHELKIESAKLASVCDELRRALNIERAKTPLDLPNPLPARTVN